MPDDARPQRVFFSLDNVRVDFVNASGGQDFLYQPNPRLAPLSRKGPARLKPGNVLDVEVRASATIAAQGAVGRAGQPGSGPWSVSQGEGLNLGISKEEVRVHIGDGECLVKTLTLTHLYCEPPTRVPQPANGSSALPQFVVRLDPGCRGRWPVEP